jgi:hypothetical protein
MQRLDLDPRARALLEPVLSVVHAGLAALPEPPSALRVVIDDRPGWWWLHGDRLALSSDFEGPGVTHPLEEPTGLPPVDRWRRAAGAVLEAASLRSIAALVGEPPGTDWRWRGPALFAADAVAPELALGDADLALAIRTGDPGGHPRAGFAVCRAWQARGDDPISRARDLLEGGVVSADEWLALGTWVFEQGPARLPAPVARRAEVDVPGSLGPWQWAPMRVAPHPRGGRVGLTGDGAITDAYAVADQVHRAVVAAGAGGCQWVAEPGGPVGRWSVTSAEAFGQVLGARGVSFAFHGSGRLEVVLADAFVGPLAALGVAGQMGTSGTADGQWAVAGAQRLQLRGIVPFGLTVHGRSRDRFMMPAQGFGLGEWLQAMCDAPWGWAVQGDRLVLRGVIGGAMVEVRLRQET